ncbi:MAG: tetratricopeptide repeat protein [Bacteroidetes bacterium]|nr:MAG: tetratricopeptide repeat protein [Bacteroidota bacterium]
MKKIYFCFCFLLLTSFIFAQDAKTKIKIDSLKSLLRNAQVDTAKALLMNELLWEYVEIDPKLTLQYAQQCLDFCQKIGFQQGLGNVYYDLGTIYRRRGNYALSLENNYKSLEIRKLLPDKSLLARTYNNLGNTYADLGSYTISLQNYFESLKILEQVNNKEGIARAMGNIGTIYADQENYPKALEYYNKALEINAALENYDLLRYNLNNIGVLYQKEGKHSDALNYFAKTLEINEKSKNRAGIAHRNYWQISARTLNYLGECRIKLNKRQECLQNYEQALEIFIKIKDEFGAAGVLKNMALFYKTEKNHEKALNYAKQSLEIGKKIGAKERIKDAASLMAEIYEKTDSKAALEYYKLATAMKDSLYSLDKDKVVNNLQTGYDLEKKQKQIEIIEKESKLKDEEVRNVNLQRNAFIVGFLLFLLFIVALMRSFKQQKKANSLLENRNREILEQREELSQQNQEIMSQQEEMQQQQETLIATNNTLAEQHELIVFQKSNLENLYEKINASIHYAQRIQSVILPDQSSFQAICQESFIIYLPKDVVSGDFYWFSPIIYSSSETINEYVLALADCTGHGVPGAFMSMVGSTLLHEIIRIKKITDPAKILKNLHAGVRNMLKQEDDKNDDGMEIAICYFKKTKEETLLTFAAAKLSLLYSKGSKLEEIKGDKQGIGGKLRKTRFDFNNEYLRLETGDLLYITSDGFSDQNDSKRNRFGKKRFIEAINGSKKLPLSAQKENLLYILDEFKGEEEQRDDISVIALKI